MRISVIVPTYNEEKMIGRCLRAIRAQKFRDFELIVVDGHSTDGTVRIAKKHADLVFFDTGCGVGNARNLAARRAKGEILAFTDADTVVCKNWLGLIDRDFRQNENLVGLSGPILSLDGKKKGMIAAKLYSQSVAALSEAVPLFAGSNCAYSKAAFLKARGFREDLYMLDDFEFSARMKKFGNLKFDKNLRVKTSMRRLKQKGYVGPVIRGVAAFLGQCCGLKVGKNYLREVKR